MTDRNLMVFFGIFELPATSHSCIPKNQVNHSLIFDDINVELIIVSLISEILLR